MQLLLQCSKESDIKTDSDPVESSTIHFFIQILTLQSPLCSVPSSRLFPPNSNTKILHKFTVYFMHATCPVHSFTSFWCHNNSPDEGYHL